jgi:hypothetical protein
VTGTNVLVSSSSAVPLGTGTSSGSSISYDGASSITFNSTGYYYVQYVATVPNGDELSLMYGSTTIESHSNTGSTVQMIFQTLINVTSVPSSVLEVKCVTGNSSLPYSNMFVMRLQ